MNWLIKFNEIRKSTAKHARGQRWCEEQKTSKKQSDIWKVVGQNSTKQPLIRREGGQIRVRRMTKEVGVRLRKWMLDIEGELDSNKWANCRRMLAIEWPSRKDEKHTTWAECVGVGSMVEQKWRRINCLDNANRPKPLTYWYDPKYAGVDLFFGKMKAGQRGRQIGPSETLTGNGMIWRKKLKTKNKQVWLTERVIS